MTTMRSETSYSRYGIACGTGDDEEGAPQRPREFGVHRESLFDLIDGDEQSLADAVAEMQRNKRTDALFTLGGMVHVVVQVKPDYEWQYEQAERALIDTISGQTGPKARNLLRRKGDRTWSPSILLDGKVRKVTQHEFILEAQGGIYPRAAAFWQIVMEEGKGVFCAPANRCRKESKGPSTDPRSPPPPKPPRAAQRSTPR